MRDYHFRITQPGSHSMSLSPDAQLHDELRDIVLAEYKKCDAPLPIRTDDKIFEILHQSTLDRIEALEESLADCLHWLETLRPKVHPLDFALFELDFSAANELLGFEPSPVFPSAHHESQ